MNKKSLLPQSRHHIIVYDEDWDWLQAHYGPGSPHEQIGVGGAIKTLVHRFVTRSKDGAMREIDSGTPATSKEHPNDPGK